MRDLISSWKKAALAAVAGADDAVLSDRDDEDDLHQEELPARRDSAGPVTRQSVQSSIISAPSDL